MIPFQSHDFEIFPISPVAANRNSPPPPIKGVPGNWRLGETYGHPTFPLDIFAAVSADKKAMKISIINPTETERSCDFGGPPATMAENALPEAPNKVTVPAANITVYEFPVK